MLYFEMKRVHLEPDALRENIALYSYVFILCWRKVTNNDFQRVWKLPNHPLRVLMSTVKDSSRELRKTQSQWPKVNTERFKQSFVNRLIFKYNQVIF